VEAERSRQARRPSDRFNSDDHGQRVTSATSEQHPRSDYSVPGEAPNCTGAAMGVICRLEICSDQKD
jgi:hypothetical protein